MSRPRSGKRTVAAIGAALAAVLAFTAALEWRSIVNEYRIWCLERADDDEANHLLSKVIAGGGSKTLVRRLWRGWPVLTQHVFDRVVRAGAEGLKNPLPEAYGEILPLLRALEPRLQGDEDLLGLWSRDVQLQSSYAESTFLESLDRMSERRKPFKMLLSAVVESFFDVSAPWRRFEEAKQQHPERLEGYVRYSLLAVLAEAWFVGMRPLPELPDAVDLLARTQEGAFTGLEEMLIAPWLRQHKPQLRYEAALGRFVLDPAAAPDPRPLHERGIPPPAALPEWLRTER
jgi:hypothetical protein